MNTPSTATNHGLNQGFFYTSMLIIVVAICTSSCSIPKNTYYFKTVPRDTIIVSANRLVESKIRRTDLLAINISSLNPAEDLMYNAAVGGSTSTSGTVSSGAGYLVDSKGNIQLHKLGIMQVEGLTRAELKNKIQRDIEPYLKDPVITVRYLNHRVTVMGEVARPAVIQMPEERLSLLEVLSASGDVTGFAKRDNILIIRDTENGKQLKRVNLEDHSIFNSDWFYLQPDDVVYVEPNDKRINEEQRNKRFQVIGLVLSGLSVAIIVLDRIFR